MLRFYGIRFNHEGLPERFTVSFALNESLNASLYIHDYFEGDVKQTQKAIGEEINKLYQNNQGSSRSQRFVVAKWFRAKDIIQFIYCQKSTVQLKLQVARILNAADRIEQKWDSIQPVLLSYLSALDAEQRDEELSNPESDLNLILQMVGLFFLEQDEEAPPANLELQFIRSQFPKIIWKKKDGLNASSNPFWLPRNRYCRPSYLFTRIISIVYESISSMEIDTPAPSSLNKHFPVASHSGLVKSEEISFHHLYPVGEPDEIRLETSGSEIENGQLTLIPETPAETLLSLQRIIQKQFSYDGVKHLLAIFRQLSEAEPDRIFSFDVFRHMKLVARAAKDGEFSKRQRKLFAEVYRMLGRLNIKRKWNQTEQTKEISNPLLLEMGAEVCSAGNLDPTKKLILDSLFFPHETNPFRLGTHLTLLPTRLFKESVHKHSLLTGLGAFFTGSWLNEYPTKNGVANKTPREIFDGCAFNITPGNKYRILDKLKSELEYMNQKCYISDVTCTEADNGNPWEDVYQVTAPRDIVSGIVQKLNSIDGCQSSERLIA